MKIELRYVDVAGRRALLHAAGRLYSMAKSEDWRPTLVGKDEGPWILSASSLLPIQLCFSSFESLLEALREAFAQDLASPDRDRRILATLRSRLSAVKVSSWTRDFPNLIRMFHDLPQGLFRGRGCSPGSALRLSVEVFSRLHTLGPFATDDLPLVLLDLAHSVYQERVGLPAVRTVLRSRRARPIALASEEDANEARLRRGLRELDRPILQSLLLWADSTYDEAALAILLRFPAQQIPIWLDLVAARLGCERMELRDPRIAEAVRGLLLAPPR